MERQELLQPSRIGACSAIDATYTSATISDNVINHDTHERPSNMLTPEAKRSKTTTLSIVKIPPVVSYPTTIPVPSKKTIKTLYTAALEERSRTQNKSPMTQTIPELSGEDEIDHFNYNDQQYLKSAGVLSLEQVLLPALALEEERAIKRIQAKIQRDAPEYKFVMENCRRLVRQSVTKAISAVQASRELRVQDQQERRRQQAIDAAKARVVREQTRQEERKRQAEKQKLQQEMSRAEKKRYLARRHPRNQELWKEVVFLTSSIAHLEKEERMWIQAERDLMRLEGNAKMSALEEEGIGSDGTGMSTAAVEESTASSVVLRASKHPLHHETEQKVKDIVLASSRIQKGLGMILKLLEESEKVRMELYEKYSRDHLFHGYQAVDNPKGMIRFLSQSQEDDYS